MTGLSLEATDPETSAFSKVCVALFRSCQVTFYSDAKYLIQRASLWVKGWQARGWRTGDGKPVANQAE